MRAKTHLDQQLGMGILGIEKAFARLHHGHHLTVIQASVGSRNGYQLSVSVQNMKIETEY